MRPPLGILRIYDADTGKILAGSDGASWWSRSTFGRRVMAEAGDGFTMARLSVAGHNTREVTE